METSDLNETQTEGQSGLDAAAIFERERPRLFAIAYRMLGSVHEAEDALQEAYLRWHQARHDTVEQHAAYLVSLVTRLCIDLLRSAQARRVTYVGPWLPEPLMEPSTATETNPTQMVELAEDLSIAFLLMLERLDPVERAVFLLHDVFDFGYREIAEVVGKSEANCRQIDHRARTRLGRENRRKIADPAEHDRLLGTFLAAIQRGAIDELVGLLSSDAVLYSDGGGKVAAARVPIAGPEKISRTLVSFSKTVHAGVRFEAATVNGRTGVLMYRGEVLQNVLALSIVDGRIEAVFIIANPEKFPRHPSVDQDA